MKNRGIDKVVSADSDHSILHPYPAVNPVMSKLGDAMSKNDTNTQYYEMPDESGD